MMWKLMLICIAASALTANGEPEPIRTRSTKKRSPSYSGTSSGSYSGSSSPRTGYSSGGYVGSSIGSSGGYAGSSAGGYAGASAGGFAGSSSGGTGGYVGTGGGYGGSYSGSYSDDDYYDDNFYAPNFGPGFIDPYVFHQQLTAHVLAQNAATQNRIQHQIAQQHYYNNLHRQPSYNRGASSTHRYAPSYASASGSIGPGGSYQSAHISPENPNTPNFSNRFSGSSSTGSNGGSGSGGGYKGVSVSSYSSSSDVNGQRTSHRGAQTTVNDNGKVTSYSVHS